MKTICIEVDAPGALKRAQREIADQRRQPFLLALPEIRKTHDGAVESLAEILDADVALAVLLTAPVCEEVGIAVLNAGAPLYVMPGARIGTESAAELTAIAGAIMVESQKHAEEVLRGAWTTGELNWRDTTGRALPDRGETRRPSPAQQLPGIRS